MKARRIRSRAVLRLVLCCAWLAAATTAQAQTGEAPLFAIARAEEAGGLTESDLTPDFVARLEAGAVGALRDKISTALTVTGRNAWEARDLMIATESMLLVVQGKRLAVVQASVIDRVREVSVMGFRNGRLYKVACMRESSEDISLFSGRCGRVVSRTFDLDPPAVQTPVDPFRPNH